MKILNEEGLLLLNKPAGITSFELVRKAGKILGIKKAGHSGTLDKEADGLMLVCFGKSTKLLTYLIGLSKRYLAEFTFGVQTKTDDKCGEVIERYEGKIDIDVIKNKLRNFIGVIKQVPPKYSAVHIDGNRAYKLANNDIDFSLKEREVEITNIEIIKHNGNSILVSIDCSSGTYIRAIARDVGLQTGYFAYISLLTRLKIGDFDISESYKLDDLNIKNYKFITPIDLIKRIKIIKLIEIKNEFVDFFKKGKLLNIKQFDSNFDCNGVYAVMSKMDFLGIIEKNDDKLFYKFVY